MVFYDSFDSLNESRPEAQDQHRKNYKADEAAGKYCQNKVPEPHFCNTCREDEQFERSRWRQHRREHERPEGVFLKALMQAIESFGRDALAQQRFSTLVANEVDDDAAQG